MLLKIEITASNIRELRKKVALAHEDLVGNDESEAFTGQLELGSEIVQSVTGPTSQTTNKTEMVAAMNEVAGSALPPVARVENVPVQAATAIPQTDSRGLKWDERIHSAERSFNKDGSWRNKRGVDKTLLAQVEAELKGSAQQTTVLPLPTPPPAPQTANDAPVFVAPPSPAAIAQVAQPTPPVQAAAVVQQAPPPPTPLPIGTHSHTLETFKENIVHTFAMLVNAGKINQDYIDQLVNYFKGKDPKVDEVFKIARNEACTKELFDLFVRAGFITAVQH